jgi:TRADD-N domain-containing protein
MELSKYQRLFLQTVYDFFRENAKWPTYRQVEIKILPDHRDFNVIEMARSLAEIQYRSFITNNPTTLAILSIEQIRQCLRSEQDLENLIRTIRYCAEKYGTSSEEKVEVSSDEIRTALQVDELAIRKIAAMTRATPIFSAMSGDVDDRKWTVLVSGDVIYFRDIQSIDDYFEGLDKRHKFYTTSYRMESPLINPAPLIEKVAQTDPADIQATTSNLMQIDNSYYINALQQSQRSFFWALVGAGVGVAFFIAAVFILIFRQPISQSYVSAIITASSGGIVEIIASIILVLHSRASTQANQCHDRLNRMQRFLVAMSHCENLEGDLKHTTRAELIKKLGDLQ